MQQIGIRALIGLIALGVAGGLSASWSKTKPPIVRATFDASGAVARPIGYRGWSHIGTRIKPAGTNILDGTQTKTPEMFNAYVEPSAMAVFEATGMWPDGTQIVKEFSTIRIGDGCDDKSWVCQSPVGEGVFQESYIGLGMMVKDATRFAGAPGNWGYFSFGHKPFPYDASATLREQAKCAGCHINLASDTDYVISRAHIGLKR